MSFHHGINNALEKNVHSIGIRGMQIASRVFVQNTLEVFTLVLKRLIFTILKTMVRYNDINVLNFFVLPYPAKIKKERLSKKLKLSKKQQFQLYSPNKGCIFSIKKAIL